MGRRSKPSEGISIVSYGVVALDAVSPHPRNPRRGDVETIAASVRDHGQYSPLVVQKSTGHILVGNHTWQGVRAAGLDAVAVVYVDCDDAEALRILLNDNADADRGEYNDSSLALVLDRLALSDGGLSGTGYTEDDLDDLLAALQEGDAPARPGPAPGGGTADRYREAATRAIVLDYPRESFRWVQSAFGRVRAGLGVDSNSDALVALLSQRTGEPPP